jgi:hypothetical protein
VKDATILLVAEQRRMTPELSGAPSPLSGAMPEVVKGQVSERPSRYKRLQVSETTRTRPDFELLVQRELDSDVADAEEARH